jgi:hypothetical protein
MHNGIAATGKRPCIIVRDFDAGVFATTDVPHLESPNRTFRLRAGK